MPVSEVEVLVSEIELRRNRVMQADTRAEDARFHVIGQIKEGIVVVKRTDSTGRMRERSTSEGPYIMEAARS